jgi:hypothetical protein
MTRTLRTVTRTVRWPRRGRQVGVNRPFSGNSVYLPMRLTLNAVHLGEFALGAAPKTTSDTSGRA